MIFYRRFWSVAFVTAHDRLLYSIRIAWCIWNLSWRMFILRTSDVSIKRGFLNTRLIHFKIAITLLMVIHHAVDLFFDLIHTGNRFDKKNRQIFFFKSTIFTHISDLVFIPFSARLLAIDLNDFKRNDMYILSRPRI